MSFGGAVFRVQKSFDQIPREFRPSDPPADAHDVHVVVFNALPRREMIHDETAPLPLLTLFAQIEAPTPLPQTAMPRSTLPFATASASGMTKSG